MANPQKENGYIKIADEIMEEFCRFRIPGSIRQIIDCILRKTYGWQKKEDWISHSQLVQMTGMKKGNVSRELSKAITHRLVIIIDNKLKFNKNYEEWISFKGNHFNPKRLSNAITNKKVIVNDTRVIASDKKVIVSEGNNIHLTKDTITKDNSIIMQQFFSIPENLEKLKTKFPLVNVDEEIEKMIDWRKNKPQRKIIDYMAFARNWLRDAKPTRQEVLVI
jgi:phage replication O-like protein O